ncbi:MAG: hypothetical protein ACI4FY_06525 [Acetatifactor sp.]
MNSSPKEVCEALALEVICFLKKWGMWRDTIILTNGNKYSYSDSSSNQYGGISNVLFEENVDPDKYTRGFLSSGEYGEESTCWKDLSNPEHIFDMVYEGPLFMLLRYEEYEVERGDIEPEAWESIFANTTILNDFMAEEYGVYDLEDFFQNFIAMSFGEFSEREREECMCAGWDPLVFNTWEEYLEMGGEAETDLSRLYECYDTYAEYLGDAEAFEILDIDMVRPIWEGMVCDAKRKIIEEEEKLYLPEIAGYLWKEWRDLFDRYDLWFELGYCWSLSCYRKQK